MKIFISADIEGVNHIACWDETEYGNPRYSEFSHQMTTEVKMACKGATEAGVKEIFVKDAHDYAKNLIFDELPTNVVLHRGWEGGIASMMGGLTKDFDAVVFIGYHSPSRSLGNPLAHTMNTSLLYCKLNGKIISEFEINAMYASYLGVPTAFLSGDKNLTEIVKAINPNIETVATKEGRFGAVVSKHPQITNQEIYEGVKKALSKDLSKNIVPLPKHFDLEFQYKDHLQAYRCSFYPKARLSENDPTIVLFSSDDYYEVLQAIKFIM